MFTPRTPHLKKTVLATTMLLVALNQGKAQKLGLQPLEVYEQSLKVFHTQKRDAARTEYQQVNKKKWWYYLPNVGLGLAYPISQADRNGTSELATRARLAPSLNVGTGVLANIDQNKNQSKAKLLAIDADAQLQYRTELHELRCKYRQIEIERDALTDNYALQKIENNIFNVAVEGNEKKEIKPVDYQQALLLYQKQATSHQQERRSLLIKIIQLEEFARYSFPVDEL